MPFPGCHLIGSNNNTSSDICRFGQYSKVDKKSPSLISYPLELSEVWASDHKSTYFQEVTVWLTELSAKAFEGLSSVHQQEVYTHFWQELQPAFHLRLRCVTQNPHVVWKEGFSQREDLTCKNLGFMARSLWWMVLFKNGFMLWSNTPPYPK